MLRPHAPFNLLRVSFFIALLIFPPTIFANQKNGIQGKGVLCLKETNVIENIIDTGRYRAFWFDSAETFEWFSHDPLDVNNNGDKFEYIRVFNPEHSHYSVGESKISLRVRSQADFSIIPGVVLDLDRYTLLLTHWVDNEISAKYSCDLFYDRTEMLRQLREISNVARIKHEEKLKTRKL